LDDNDFDAQLSLKGTSGVVHSWVLSHDFASFYSHHLL
jgi:hypothetical protein